MIGGKTKVEGSNNTNKLSPQELLVSYNRHIHRSNNTNKLSPQEHIKEIDQKEYVQIIQINLVLKN